MKTLMENAIVSKLIGELDIADRVESSMCDSDS